MRFLIMAINRTVSRFPRLRTRVFRPCGRMAPALQAVMALAGVGLGATAIAGAFLARRAAEEPSLGRFPATTIGLVAVFLLASAARTLLHALRNPLPPALPNNVIPFPSAGRVASRDLDSYRNWDR